MGKIAQDNLFVPLRYIVLLDYAKKIERQLFFLTHLVWGDDLGIAVPPSFSFKLDSESYNREHSLRISSGLFTELFRGSILFMNERW